MSIIIINSTLWIYIGLILLVGTFCFESIHGQAQRSNVVTKFDWKQLGSDIEGKKTDTTFGAFLAMSADGMTIVVSGSIPDINTTYFSRSYFRVMKYNKFILQWEQVGSEIKDKFDLNSFGHHVAVTGDGTTIAVRTRYPNPIKGADPTGQVRVFKLDLNTNEWIQVGQDIDGGIEDDSLKLYGATASLSTDGTVIAISAPVTIGFCLIGRVRVLKLSSGNTWIQLGKDIFNKANEDCIRYRDSFGGNIDLSADGTILIVGASEYNVGSRETTGSVYVYKLDKMSSQWVQVGQDLLGSQRYEYYGHSLAISSNGSMIAVGAVHHRINRTTVGNVRVFQINDTGRRWLQIGQSMNGTLAFGYFGDSIAMAADGKTIAIGVSSHDANGYRSGKVQVMKLDANTTQWVQLGSDINGENANDYFGRKVSLSDDGTIVGCTSPYYNGGGVGSGHVRIFNYTKIVPPVSNCKVSWKLYNSQTDAFVTTITNGKIITNPPPCNRTNIEVVYSGNTCGVLKNSTVIMELFTATDIRIHRRVEKFEKYFLFGNQGSNIYNGSIDPSTYYVRSTFNGTASPKTKFTLVGCK